MKRKYKSIRTKFVISLVVPVMALSALWGLDVHASVADALALRSAYSTRDQVGRPSEVLLQALQAERSQSQEFLAILPRSADTLRALRAATDTAVADFRRLSSQYHGHGSAADITHARITDLLTQLASLARIRSQISAGSISRAAALSGYNSLISYVFNVLSATAAFSDLLAERVMRIVVAIRHAGEVLSQEDALLTGAITAGRFGNGEYLQFVETAGALRFQLPAAGSALPEQDQAAYLSMLSNPTFTALRSTEDHIIRDGWSGGTVPITLEVWKATFNPAVKQIYDFLRNGYDRAIGYARAAGDRILTRFSIAGGLGLFAILLSLFLAIRIGRSVVDRLSVLHTAAIDLASRRLPDVVARLRAGERVDVAEESLRPPQGEDEIAAVGAALAEVQRSAIDSAVAEAALRDGVSKVLVNVARRNQSLISRQLKALTQIRASTATGQAPVALAEQLAVRMRRHAEHLVILTGTARHRGGLRPVPLAGIIASAASEVEGAERIEIRSIVDMALSGWAATDVGHLLAELLENATAFSPPDTPVRVSAQRIPHGVAVEIEDRGLGMTPSALAEANSVLAEPPDFDPANSARLGLFVVAQLAAARAIRVCLQPSGFGGVTAVVILPPALVDTDSGAASTSQLVPASGPLDAPLPVGAPAIPELVSTVHAGPLRRAAQSSLPPSTTPSTSDRQVQLSGDLGVATAAPPSTPLPRRKPTSDSAPPLAQ